MSTQSLQSERYNALDCVRAAAMLLGVVYHSLLFRMFMGGGPPMMPGMGRGSSAEYFQDWLHSFRMPLFFLISGFFASMMLQKYGLWTYLQKRWYRIGTCLVIGMFTFGPIYVLTREATSNMPGRPGGPMGGPGPRPAGSANVNPGPAAEADDFPKPPDGFIPPPLAEFDKNGDGSFSDAEWKEARVELKKMFGDGPPPGPGGGPGMGGPLPGIGGGSGGPPGFGLGRRSPGGGGPFGGGPGYSQLIFGDSARLVQLNHLWFLWYLLIFIPLAPLTAKILGWALLWPNPGTADRLSRRIIGAGLLAPLALGLVTTPALMLSSGPFGWSLGMPGSIFRAFPDFLLHFDPEMAFYFIVFLFGWWLRRERGALPGLTRAWIPNLLLGLVAFAGSTMLSQAYGRNFDHPHYQLIRTLGYGLYALSSASTVFGIIGLFQRFFDKPTPIGRYLADTALWVYLIHQPLVLIGLYWFMPYHWPWPVQTAVVSLFASAIALLLYEAMVRPTPLVKLFGPAAVRPSAKPRSETGMSGLSGELVPS